MIARLLCRILGHRRARMIFKDPDVGYWRECERCGDRKILMWFHQEPLVLEDVDKCECPR